MSEQRPHPYLRTLAARLAEGRVERRELLRTATMLGLAAGTACSMAGLGGAAHLVPAARAAMPKDRRQTMGGEIAVETEPGKGSSFRVWLPRRLPAEMEARDAAGSYR